MKITFVQNDAEYEEAQRVVRAGLSLRKAKKGTWVIPPSLSTRKTPASSTSSARWSNFR